MIFKGKKKTFALIRETKTGKMLATIRLGSKNREIQVQSFQNLTDHELEALQKDMQQLK